MMSGRLNDQLHTYCSVHAPSLKGTHKYTHAITRSQWTKCVLVSGWWVGWGALAFDLELRGQAADGRPAGHFHLKDPRGPLSSIVAHTHMHTLLSSPPSFHLYLIFSCCGWSDGLWVWRSHSHSFLSNWGSNGEVYAGNLSSHWVMSHFLLSCVYVHLVFCVFCFGGSVQPCSDPVNDVFPPLSMVALYC